MTAQETILLKLSAQLKSFGLNPLDWSLRPLGGLKISIFNRNDETLALLGQVEYRNQQLTWKSLELADF
ncbi:MAG: hypothetical protein HUU57_16225 [Bdellovibrio sp.]|nr:hypothetical protein [Bdellovibrio sp.]